MANYKPHKTLEPNVEKRIKVCNMYKSIVVQEINSL